MTGTAQVVAGWSLAASMAVTLATIALRGGRRRSAINEALHELRRPLQAISLSATPGKGGAGGPESSMRLVSAALERLDREVNGGSRGLGREPVRFETVLRPAVGRWRARVALGGGSLDLRWRAADAVVVGDATALEQAIDNLIVNAIEHGGPEVVVEGRRRDGRLQVSVVDSGFGSRPDLRREGPEGPVARMTGRRRHGHGLAVVRRIAAAHGGRFMLRRSPQGTVAALELPLAASLAEPAG